MTGTPAHWAAGFCASLLANAVIGTVLYAAMRPAPVEQQHAPQSELDVQAYQLERQQALARAPEPERAARADPDSPTVDPGRIPRTQARGQQPAATRLVDRPPAQDRLAAAQSGSDRQSPAKPEANRIAPLRDTGERLADLDVPSHAVLQAPRPETPSLPPITATGTAIASARQAGQTLPSLPATGKSAAPLRAQPDRIKAALAFSGGGAGDIDPASLAAFQSFVHPRDMTPQGSGMRDAVSALLAQVPCSRLQVEFDPVSTTLTVKGHIPENDLRGPVLTALQAQMGADIAVSDDMLVLPRPQCGALAGIASVGLAQSTDQITNPLLIGEDTHVRSLSFVRDDRLYFDLRAPDYDAYLYVDYFDADGNVLHLAPNEMVPQSVVPARSVWQVGARSAGDDGLQILIGPPYGQEIAAAFAASAPLYDTPRPLIEPAPGYLAWLRERVAITRAAVSDFKGEWVYFFVTTRAE
ncbi:DUF4384 domain-containing protein [Microbulbifer sp. S227A]|uniref:DUF4384 domain-containing protein n=1 Tax=Microbulbifer sp. S227A TaxID=3415131 RepID=UPI003C7BBDAD